MQHFSRFFYTFYNFSSFPTSVHSPQSFTLQIFHLFNGGLETVARLVSRLGGIETRRSFWGFRRIQWPFLTLSFLKQPLEGRLDDLVGRHPINLDVHFCEL